MPKSSPKLPRGIRNNNPLNIRISSNKWIGKATPSTDPAFEQFDTIEHGIRAAFCIIRTYIIKHGCRTVHDLITRWAPAADGNNVEAYVAQVLRISNTSQNEPLYFTRRLQMCTILYAMHVVECGRIYYPLSLFLHVYDTYFAQK